MPAALLTFLVVTQSPTCTNDATAHSSTAERAKALQQILIAQEKSRKELIEHGAAVLETRPSTNLIRRASNGGSARLVTSEILLTLAQLRKNAAKFQETRLETLRVCEVTAKTWDDAVVVYEKGASELEKKAEQEPYAQLKEEYIALAKSWRGWASKALNRAKDIRSENNEIEAFYPFLERIEILLGHLDEHLSSLPPFPDETEREAAMNRVRQFIQQFEKLRQDIRQLELSDPPTTSPKAPSDNYESPESPSPGAVARRSRVLSQSSGGFRPSNSVRRPYAITR